MSQENHERTAVERFNLLYRNSFDKVCRFANFYVRNTQAAEDITMDAFLKLFEQMKAEKVDMPMPLLLTIVKHRALDYLKMQQCRQDTETNLLEWKQRELNIRISTLDACNPDDLFSHEIQLIVMQTLARLPEQTRRVFEMSRMENKSNSEIARMLGITVKGVEYHIGKALKELRVALKDYLFVLALLVSPLLASIPGR